MEKTSNQVKILEPVGRLPAYVLCVVCGGGWIACSDAMRCACGNSEQDRGEIGKTETTGARRTMGVGVGMGGLKKPGSLDDPRRDASRVTY